MIIKRLSDDGVQTLGIMTLPNGKVYHTLELAWKNNNKKVSCIPKGKYKVKKRTSAKYGEHFHILDVKNRDFILIHHGNYAGSLNPKTNKSDILGCILVGSGLKDLNNDGILDVTNSKKAMAELLKYLPNEFELNIV
jgi:hypothetical protein